MTLLAADGVGVRHRGHAGFTPADVSLRVEPGEVVLLLGPSGCGKSTFALTLNGLVPQSVPADVRGTVAVGPGLDGTTTPVARLAEHVAMVFQDPDASVVTGSVLDEVCFGPENLCLPADVVLARAEDALRRVGLWDRRADDPDVLSGGGRQRLAIACALALGSPLLVLDEPTANLDPAGIEEFYATLADVVQDPQGAGRGVLLVEHNLDACAALVTRVVVLDRRGRVVLDGPTRDVLCDRAEELRSLGVWLPVATLAGLRLRAAGLLRPDADGVARLPLTPDELAARLPRPPGPARGTGLGDASDGPHPDLPEPVVEVRDLRLRRGGHGLTRRRREATGRVVLDGVSFSVRPGELHAVVGVNGAGKSTLLQAVAGVVPPPRGAVRIAGLDPARADVRDLATRVGFVFQNPEHQLVRHTVAEELAHALEVRRVPRAEIDARVDDVLGRFGLRSHRAVHPFLLSGGQKRRLSVGTALVAGAEVLVLDEPTFGQDQERAAELLALLHDLVAGGAAVLLATHDLQLVAEHATHVLVLHEGRVAAHGPAGDVLASDALLTAGLRRPPLSAALHGTPWADVTRVDDLVSAVAAARQAVP